VYINKTGDTKYGILPGRNNTYEGV